MKRLAFAVTLVILVAASVAACASGGQNDEEVILRRDPPGRLSGPWGQGPALKTEDLAVDEDEAVELAVSALQQRTDLSREEIKFGGIQSVEWSDSSLGCPQPGMSYLQVITPGYRVILDVGARRHSVHVGRQSAVVCDRAVRSVPSRSRAGDILRLERLAKADLSTKLSIPADTIKRKFLKSATWPDTRLGCEARGDHFETVETTGFVLGLIAGSRLYTYHTDMDRIFACPEVAMD